MRADRFALFAVFVLPACSLQASGIAELATGGHATWVEQQFAASADGSLEAASLHQFVVSPEPGYCDAARAVQSSFDQLGEELGAAPDDCAPEGRHLQRMADAMGPFSDVGGVTLTIDVMPDEPDDRLPAGTYSTGGEGPNEVRVFLAHHLANVHAEQLEAFDADDPLCRSQDFEFTQPAREVRRATTAELRLEGDTGAGRRMTLDAELRLESADDGEEPLVVSVAGVAEHCVIDAGPQMIVGR